MKKIISITFAITAFLSCHNQPQPTSDSQVHFANKTDFICGMEVRPDWTDTCNYNGKTYAFCGTSCKEEFLKNPEQYLTKQ